MSNEIGTAPGTIHTVYEAFGEDADGAKGESHGYFVDKSDAIVASIPHTWGQGRVDEVRVIADTEGKLWRVTRQIKVTESRDVLEAKEKFREKALSKLSPAEREALGFD